MTLAGWTLSFLRPYRARVTAIVALSLLEIGLAALAPWPLKAVVDNVLGGHPLPAVVAAPAQALSGGSAAGLLALISDASCSRRPATTINASSPAALPPESACAGAATTAGRG